MLATSSLALPGLTSIKSSARRVCGRWVCSGVSGPRAAKHEDQPHHRRAKAHAGAEKLNDIHSAVHFEARTLRHTVESRQTNHQWDCPDCYWRPFIIHMPSLDD